MESFQRVVGSRTLVLETGKLAQLANGSVLVRSGDSVLLVAATMGSPREGVDFFPMTIDFEERLYARGKIPGSFFRREGRPTTEAILTDRLTDRPLRPLFPEGFRHEVQVVATPFSTDMESPLDILAINGASAALSISDIPFERPIGATRVGYVGGEFVINPTYEQIQTGDLDIVVAGTRDGVMMMEAGASEASEDLVLEAIHRGQEANLEVIALQEEAMRSVGKAKMEFHAPGHSEELEAQVVGILDGRLAAAFESGGEPDLDPLKEELLAKLGEEHRPRDVIDVFKSQAESQEKKTFRSRVLAGEPRPDGRAAGEIRPISGEVGLLPRTHGSGLFTRGETQVLGVVTLGSPGDAQKLDNLSPADQKRFMLHYNFPPYSTGESGRVGSPRRRDIGHGALAERALAAVLPDDEVFPYTLRIVAEVLSSNGSTSMGSVCAATLALMDAGVPMKAPVAGISIGLVTGENDRFVTLTDIQGLEDHAGDMDFKVAGTAEGITAIQLDIKVKSISYEIIEAALAEAKEARLFLLDRMKETIEVARPDVSQYAPRMTRISVPVSKIGMIIGPGGKTIRGIVEETGATVDVEDDGTVIITSAQKEAADRAVEIIEGLTKEAKVGEIYTGKVVRILDFGAFVQILPGKDGMVHISELANERVPSVEDVVQLGEEITVMVKDVDPSGRIALSRRALLQDSDTPGESPVQSSGPPSGPPSGYRSSGPRAGNGRSRGGRPGGGRGGRPPFRRPPPR